MATEQERNRGLGAYSTPGLAVPPETGPSAIHTVNPVVIFKLQNVDPPSVQYISQADRLAITAANSDPNITQLLINGRILRASDGQISPFNFTMNIGVTRAVTTQLYDLTEGYLLDLECLGNGGTNRGRCYIQARLVRGISPGFTEYSQLISDNFSRA
ncbi:MAG: hypothetical protein HRJ53_07550, partial [Acidobacteria bacterium Pan2503]|nr:hypothetical protein [Candidatus Acidoferrum panamensis]